MPALGLAWTQSEWDWRTVLFLHFDISPDSRCRRCGGRDSRCWCCRGSRNWCRSRSRRRRGEGGRGGRGGGCGGGGGGRREWLRGGSGGGGGMLPDADRLV